MKGGVATTYLALTGTTGLLAALSSGKAENEAGPTLGRRRGAPDGPKRPPVRRTSEDLHVMRIACNMIRSSRAI